jgi:hypothetical protein
MKTKIQNFMQVLTLHSVSFVIVFAVGFTALGAWNWSTRVSDGDVLTSEKWNAIVAQLEAVEQKASSAEAKANTAQNMANSKVDKSYVDTKVSTASVDYLDIGRFISGQYRKNTTCESGFVFLIMEGNKGICVQKNANSGGQSFTTATNYCKQNYGNTSRIISHQEYYKACNSWPRMLNNIGVWEKTNSFFTDGTERNATTVGGGTACQSLYTCANNNWVNQQRNNSYQFRCVY